MRVLLGVTLLVFLGCTPEAPRISTEPIKSIVVTIYKNEGLTGWKDDYTVTIPKGDWETILAFTLPDKWADAGPVGHPMGTVEIKYRDKDKKPVSINVFDSGKNPCMVSLNGRIFYYAKHNKDYPVGVAGLISKLSDIRDAISNEKAKDKWKQEMKKRAS